MKDKLLKKYLVGLKKNLHKDLDQFCQTIPNEILSKKEFIEYAIQITSAIYKYAPIEIKENKEILIKALGNDKFAEINNFIPDSLIKDEDIIKIIIRNIGSLKYLFSKIDLNTETNQAYTVQSLKSNINRFSELPESLKKDRDFLLKAVKINGRIIGFTDDLFKDDDEIVMEAVKSEGSALEYASKRLQNNKAIALTAFKTQNTKGNTYRLFYIFLEFRNNRELALEAMKEEYGRVFILLSDELKKDIHFGIETFKSNNSLLLNNEVYANTYINNIDFILFVLNNTNPTEDLYFKILQKIISKNSNNSIIILETLKLINKFQKHYKGYFLSGTYSYYVDKTFDLIDSTIKNDINFFKNVILINGLYLEFGGFDVKSNYNIVYEAVKGNGLSIYFADEKLQKDETLIDEAIKNGSGTKILTAELSTRENLIIALKNLPEISRKITNRLNFIDTPPPRYCYIKNASQTLKNDREFCLLAVKSDGMNVMYISDTLLQDIEMISEAFKNAQRLNLFAFDHRLSIYNDNKKLILELIETGADPLEHVSSKLQDDFDVVMKAVTNDGSQLKFASDRLKNNTEIVLKAIEDDSKNFQYASDQIKSNREFILSIINTTKYYERGKSSPKIISENPAYFSFSPDLENILPYCSEQIKSDRDLMIQAVKQDGNLLQFATDHLKADKDILIKALQNKPTKDVLHYASKKLQEDLDALIITLKN